jgi:hypothetical protein
MRHHLQPMRQSPASPASPANPVGRRLKHGRSFVEPEKKVFLKTLKKRSGFLRVGEGMDPETSSG